MTYMGRAGPDFRIFSARPDKFAPAERPGPEFPIYDL
jgi:hypothetical protein